MAPFRWLRLLPISCLAVATDAQPRRARVERVAPVTPPAADSHGAALRVLSQAEGLLRVGHAQSAARLLASVDESGPHAASLARVHAWALFAAADYAAVTRLIPNDPGQGDELAFLRGAALCRLGSAAGTEALRALWWEAPEGTWGLAALRELAAAGQYRTAERRVILARLEPPRFDGPLTPPPTRLFAALAREAPPQGQLAAEARAALGAHFLRSEKFSSAAVALGAARVAAPTPALRRVITLRLGEAERRRGNYSTAQRHFATVAAGGRDALTADANALAGQMAIEFRRYPDARSHFEAQLVHNPVGPARHEALWGLGFVALRSGDFRAARRFFDALHAEAPFGPLSPRALFWAGRAREELGDRSAAAAHMAALVQQFPVDYYAHRAQVWLDGADLTAERIQAVPMTPQPEPRVERALALAHAGMRQRAVRALTELQAFTLAPADLVRLEQASITALAPALAERFRAARARRFPDAGGADVIASTFPETYRRLIAGEAQRQRLDPALLASLIRQESGFRADAVSSVGALGLMQLMPTTAHLLYQEEGRHAPSNAALFDPPTNVRLGSRYLGRMLRAFDRRLEYALAAYNAGPGAVTRWRQARGDLPVDIFVEEIPYAETRTYVENVLAGARAFTWLTQAQPQPMQAQARLP